MSQTEQLLRRMTGSITAYMDEVANGPSASATMTERCWRSETGNLMRSVRSIPRYRIRRTIC